MEVFTFTQEQLLAINNAIENTRRSIAERIDATLNINFPKLQIPDEIQDLLMNIYTYKDWVFDAASVAEYLFSTGGIVSWFSDTTPIQILLAWDQKKIDLITKNLKNILYSNWA